jgi:hypothetical protein
METSTRDSRLLREQAGHAAVFAGLGSRRGMPRVFEITHAEHNPGKAGDSFPRGSSSARIFCSGGDIFVNF